ncbi:MAG: hypothetical protein ACPG4T_17515 [Nannocystaceae bacterium]
MDEQLKKLRVELDKNKTQTSTALAVGSVAAAMSIASSLYTFFGIRKYTSCSCSTPANKEAAASTRRHWAR